MKRENEQKFFEEMAATPTGRRVVVTMKQPGVATAVLSESILQDVQPVAGRSGSSDAIYVYGTENYEREIEALEERWGKINERRIGDDATLADIVTMQKFQNMRVPTPSGMEIISAFCKCDPESLVVIKKGLPAMMTNVARFAFAQLSDDPKSPWKFSTVSAKIGKNEYSIPSNMKEMITISIGPGRTAVVPGLPTVAVSDAKGEKRCVMSFQQTATGSVYISFIGNKRNVLEDVSTWFDTQIIRFNFLKKAKIDGEGNFLQIGKTTWDDIVLSAGIREKIDVNIINMFEMEPVYTANGIPAKRGFVVLGEPGTGKTTLARILATVLTDVTFIWITPSTIYGSSSIANIYDLAQQLAPSIVFFEDADIYLAQRGSLEASGGILTEIMNRLDGVVPLKGVVTGISTNRPEVLERAIVDRPGRFDLKIYLGPPDGEGRVKILMKRLSKVKVDPRDIQKASDDPGMARMTPCIIEEIARRAIMRAIEAKHYDKHTQQASVSLEDLLEAIKEYNGERGLTQGDYTSEQRIPSRIAKSIMEANGLTNVQEGVVEAENVRSFLTVAFGTEFEIKDSDYNKKISSIDGLQPYLEGIFENAEMIRLIKRQGVTRKNIRAALKVINNDESTLNDVVIALTGESE